jgi:hypothetical protein
MLIVSVNISQRSARVQSTHSCERTGSAGPGVVSGRVRIGRSLNAGLSQIRQVGWVSFTCCRQAAWKTENRLDLELSDCECWNDIQRNIQAYLFSATATRHGLQRLPSMSKQAPSPDACHPYLRHLVVLCSKGGFGGPGKISRSRSFTSIPRSFASCHCRG